MSTPELGETAESILERIFAELDESRIADTIDVPVERAAMTFGLVAGSAYSHRQFHRIMGELARHLFLHGQRFPQDIPLDQAKGEAIRLLQHAYRDGGVDGYIAAYLDAQDPEFGIETVIARMIETFRAIKKQDYMDAVFSAHVLPRDWDARRRIVALLFELWSEVLPQYIADRAPDELADDIRGIVEIVLNQRSAARRIAMTDIS